MFLVSINEKNENEMKKTLDLIEFGLFMRIDVSSAKHVQMLSNQLILDDATVMMIKSNQIK
ncbi:hypothetical protein DERP_008522 [Dermatophagoides pteronyssinus]|uniref:Uncharacterized protein n=1 Tax=Dermatophagoides pteronyssinus TaxID=6956 RepID=A0ABQ8IVI1_DERPT|nr:hypothetical protein DERP_008522 [Dermatophagoides pteronyssinus]